MKKIVDRALKIDLHIHSCFSHRKDKKSLIGKNNIKNIDKLFTKLQENKIDMFSITDHDYFSYALYSELRKKAKVKNKKILPGVEFSVAIDDNDQTKNIHVIAIFNDDDEEKIKLIEKYVNNTYNNQNGTSFTKDKFEKILQSINLDVVLIAHQKGSVSSEEGPLDNDLNSLSDTKFNEFLNGEYFESLEFKNMKNGIFNHIFAKCHNEKHDYDIVKFITGSDCHDWEYYPKYDKNESDRIDFRFTYLKCLPCFKGLALALTDYSRIKTEDSFFTPSQKCLESIDLTIRNQNISIPLSKGINVIIGDNSIGKSLIFNKIFNRKVKSEVKKGYDNFLTKHRISIKTQLNSKMPCVYDAQGEIREKFSLGKQDNTSFLHSKFPTDPNLRNELDKVNKILDQYYKPIENKLLYDEELKNIGSVIVITQEHETKIVKVVKINDNSQGSVKSKNIKKITDFLNSTIHLFEDNIKLFSMEEQKFFNGVIEQINSINNKYNKIQKENNLKINIKISIDLGITNFDKKIEKYKNDYDKLHSLQQNQISSLSLKITNLIKYKEGIHEFKYDKKFDFSYMPEKKIYGDYIFLKGPKNFAGLNEKYFNSLISRSIKNNMKINTSKITKEELAKVVRNDLIKDEDRKQLTEFELFKKNIEYTLNFDLYILPSIVKKDNKSDLYQKYSNGMNATIYFSILSKDDNEGIYVIDQPEDDVSQKSIRSDLIKCFKEMSYKKQLFLITHNPQFVVNIDADNVICLEWSDQEISVYSGALEYDKILDKVAMNLEGGIESIKERWKKYGKSKE